LEFKLGPCGGHRWQFDLRVFGLGVDVGMACFVDLDAGDRLVSRGRGWLRRYVAARLAVQGWIAYDRRR
jgi:hypothetical protein